MFASKNIKSKTNASVATPKANSLFFQPSLKVGKPADKYEVEADKVADEVVNNPQNENQPLFMQPYTNTVQAKSNTFFSGNPTAKTEAPPIEMQAVEEEEEVLQTQVIEEEDEMLQTKSLEEEEEVQTKSNEQIPTNPSLESRSQSRRGNGFITKKKDGQLKNKLTTQRAGNIIQLTPDEDFLNTSNIQLMQCVTSFDYLYRLSSDYSIGARQIGDAVRTKYLAEAEKYETAYTLYSNIIADAREEAQNQNMWIGIVVGVAAGIGLGLLAAYAIPATAGAAAFSITLGEAGAAVTSSAVQAGVGAVITSGVTSSLSVAGSDLQPTGLSPEVVRTSVWQKVAEIYREGLLQVEVQQRLHNLSLQSLEVRRQVQQRLNGNETALGMPELYTIVPILYGARTSLFPYDDMYEQRLSLQSNILDQINQLSGPSSGEMERGIWILWINELDIADSDILDLDAIENHLRNIGLIGSDDNPGGILGVNFGIWTSRQDEVNAIFASIPHASRIRRMFENLQTGSIDVISSPNPFSSST